MSLSTFVVSSSFFFLGDRVHLFLEEDLSTFHWAWLSCISFKSFLAISISFHMNVPSAVMSSIDFDIDF
jgi:hypothetical protein